MAKSYLQWIVLSLGLLIQPAVADTILFDQGHGQRFKIEGNKELDLSRFAQLFARQSNEVTARSTLISSSLLENVDLLIISGAFKDFNPREILALKHYIYQGGQLIITLHVGLLNRNLLKAFSVDVSNGIIRAEKNLINNEASSFTTRNLTPHPLTSGLEEVSFYGAWAIRSLKIPAVEIIHTHQDAWIDLNSNQKLDRDSETTSKWPLALAGKIGLGNYVVFGDDAIFQNRFLVKDNLKLAKNLVNWLREERQKSRQHQSLKHVQYETRSLPDSTYY